MRTYFEAMLNKTTERLLIGEIANGTRMICVTVCIICTRGFVENRFLTFVRFK